MSSGPADLLDLMAINLCSTKSSDTNIPETEYRGAGHPVWSICCKTLSILRFCCQVLCRAKNSFIKFALSLSLTVRLPSSHFRGPILLLLTGLVTSAIKFQYAAAELTEAIFSLKYRDFDDFAFLNSDVISFQTFLYLEWIF